ncbi:hypothetical protein [Acetobacter pasteurianus]|uniref:hypothetical protein n=1 Tax=Acetobacter pasteurianus TaxID=438 RepID=UPI0013631898|nr:hypothetical protein [Acetobacter pasteurianus]QHM90094.1 hypothetical protein FCN51_00410 [Acetobacter pasteurianus]
MAFLEAPVESSDIRLLKLLPLVILSCALVLVFPEFAMAESTLGGAIGHFGGNINGPFWKLLMVASLLSGLGCIYKGLKLLIMVADGRSHHVISYAPPTGMLIAGALLVAIPDTMNYGIASFFGYVTGYHGSTYDTFGNPSDCISSTTALTCAAKNVRTNIVPVFIQVSFVLMFLVGGWYLYTIILSAAHEVGSGRPLSRNLAFRGLVAFLMMNMSALMAFGLASLGSSDNPLTNTGFNGDSDMLSYTGSSNISIVQNYSELIGYTFAILAMFGVAAFWKGLFILKDVADGNARTGPGTAFMHMIFGAGLTSIKWLGGIATMSIFGRNLFS